MAALRSAVPKFGVGVVSRERDASSVLDLLSRQHLSLRVDDFDPRFELKFGHPR